MNGFVAAVSFFAAAITAVWWGDYSKAAYCMAMAAYFEICSAMEEKK